MLIQPVRRSDAQRGLLRALEPLLGAATLIAARSSPWASVTFSGARHECEFVLAGSDASARAERLCAALPEHDFQLRNHLVAEIVGRIVPHPAHVLVAIEALTIEED